MSGMSNYSANTWINKSVKDSQLLSVGLYKTKYYPKYPNILIICYTMESWLEILSAASQRIGYTSFSVHMREIK